MWPARSQLPRLVVDIGGRSTEMILVEAACRNAPNRSKVGSVSLSLAHSPRGASAGASVRPRCAGAELEEGLTLFTPRSGGKLGSIWHRGRGVTAARVNNITDGGSHEVFALVH